MSKFLIVMALIVAALALAVGFSALFGWMFWLAWGFVAVPVFGAPALSYLQAWALWFLISLVLGTLRACGGGK